MRGGLVVGSHLQVFFPKGSSVMVQTKQGRSCQTRHQGYDYMLLGAPPPPGACTAGGREVHTWPAWLSSGGARSLQVVQPPFIDRWDQTRSPENTHRCLVSRLKEAVIFLQIHEIRMRRKKTISQFDPMLLFWINGNNLATWAKQELYRLKPMKTNECLAVSEKNRAESGGPISSVLHRNLRNADAILIFLLQTYKIL